MKLTECPEFQKGTLRLPTPEPRFVGESWSENGMVGGRELWLDLDLPHGGNEELLLDPACDARVETLRYRARKAERREAGFVVIRDEPHYDTGGNVIADRVFTFPLSSATTPSTNEGPLIGRVPFWSLYRMGSIQNNITTQNFTVPIVRGEPFTQDNTGQFTPQWSGGRMDTYLKFRVTALNAQGIREEGPESVTVRIAPYPYPVHLDGGNNTNRLGVGMADGPIYG